MRVESIQEMKELENFLDYLLIVFVDFRNG